MMLLQHTHPVTTCAHQSHTSLIHSEKEDENQGHGVCQAYMCLQKQNFSFRIRMREFHTNLRPFFKLLLLGLLEMCRLQREDCQVTLCDMVRAERASREGRGL